MKIKPIIGFPALSIVNAMPLPSPHCLIVRIAQKSRESVIGLRFSRTGATALIVIALIVIARATEAGARRPEVSCAIDALA